MEGCVDCVTAFEFWSALTLGVLSFWATLWGIRSWEGYQRDLMIEEWHRMVVQQQTLREREEKKLLERVQDECT